MTRTELNQALLQSEVVIARAGYSTIMDLVQLRCSKVLLVPTPGQTEQEYLAERFYQQKHFLDQSQKELNLALALEQLQGFSGISTLEIDNNILLERVIKNFLYNLAT